MWYPLTTFYGLYSGCGDSDKSFISGYFLGCWRFFSGAIMTHAPFFLTKSTLYVTKDRTSYLRILGYTRLLCISTSFWVLRPPKSWSNYFIKSLLCLIPWCDLQSRTDHSPPSCKLLENCLYLIPFILL